MYIHWYTGLFLDKHHTEWSLLDYSVCDWSWNLKIGDMGQIILVLNLFLCDKIQLNLKSEVELK